MVSCSYEWLQRAFNKRFCRLLFTQKANEWEELSTIFGKEPTILQYQAVKLINQKKGTKRKWESEESNLLQEIIK